MSVTAIIVAAGKGTRMGAAINKIFLPLLDKTVIEHTVEAFNNTECIDEIVLVTREEDIGKLGKLTKKFDKVKTIVKGGQTRQQSVYEGIKVAEGDMVAIHDGARALITPEEITAVVSAAERYGAAAPGQKIKDTLKKVDGGGFISGTIDRERTVKIATPQVFYIDSLSDMYERAIAEELDFTDDCGLVEHFGGSIKVEMGSYDNIKLTTAEDMYIAENILKKRSGQIL